MAVTQDVTRWLDTIHDVREEMELYSSKYPDAVVMAFMHIESHGDPWARRDGSAFHGILQIARPYMMDGLGADIVHPKLLMGDVALSLRVFFGYMERYHARHDYHPSLMAVAHKGGAGTVKTAHALYMSGVPLTNAIAQAEEKHDIHNLQEYVRRFCAALQNYAVWVDDQNKPFGVCANEVLEDE